MPETHHTPRLMTMDRILQAGEPARKLVRGETTLTRLALGRMAVNPLLSCIWIGGTAAALAIVANIVLLQPERHHAPMFVGNPMIHGKPQPSMAPLPPQRPVQLDRDAELQRKTDLNRDIQQELARRGFYDGAIDSTASTRTVQAVRDFQAAANLPVNGQMTEAVLATILTSNVQPKDQILGVLRATQDRLERPETVVAIQRALTKLGYGPLRDDGHFGSGTRTALDRFEKERRLAPRGDNPARTLRELAQASGIAID